MPTPRMPVPSPDVSTAPEDLRRAYASALYHIERYAPATFTTNTAPGDVARWLDALGAHSATVVTAWNPFSERLPDAENEAAGTELRRAVVDAGLAYVDARGTDPEGVWSEDSLCVFDASEGTVDLWLRAFGQNAVLVLRRGDAPALRWHPAYRGERGDPAPFGSDTGPTLKLRPEPPGNAHGRPGP